MPITPKLAVLMSVYGNDDPLLLSRAIDSIVNQQALDNYDLRFYVAIDGPINQDLSKVIDFYTPILFKLIKIENNRGLANALNVLLDSLEDETFIFRMDADDESLPNRLKSQLDYMISHPVIDILGTSIYEKNLSNGHTSLVHFAPSNQVAVANLHKRAPVAHATVCIQRRVFEGGVRYPTEGTNEDIALWFLLSKYGFTFSNILEPLYVVHINDDFWNRRGFKKAMSEFKIYVHGIWTTDRYSTKYIFPLMRFLIRISPKFVSRFFYHSSLRSSFASKKIH